MIVEHLQLVIAIAVPLMSMTVRVSASIDHMGRFHNCNGALKEMPIVSD